MNAAIGNFIWVDDEEGFRERVRTVAQTAGFGDEAPLLPVLADGKDELRAVIAAVEAKERQVPRFIILDLDLEDENYDGIQALREIRKCEQLALCPIVIHSRHLEEQSVRASYSHQANSVVQKPGQVKEQKKTILDLIRYWSSVNRMAL